jgi:hypothetical protein
MDTELFRERIIRQAVPTVTGRFVGYRPSYTREIKVAQPLLLAVLVAAGVARAMGALVLSALRAGTGAPSARRRFRDLRKGPEFLVTPVRLRDDFGQAYEVEMHGHLPQSALHKGDLVQIATVAQKDPTLPVRMRHAVNLTTMQLLTPHIPNLWSHFGPGLLLQAGLGLGVATVAAAAWLR